MHTALVISYYVIVVIMLLITMTLFTHQPSRLQQLATGICMSLSVSCIGYVIRVEAINLESLMNGQKVMYAFLMQAMFFILMFSFEYCNYKLPGAVRHFFETINMLITVVALTMNHHHLFYSKVWVEMPQPGVYRLGREYGWVHTVFIVMFLIYMLGCIALIALYSSKNYHKRVIYVRRLISVFLRPCISYILSRVLGMENDAVPFAFLLLAGNLLYMIYQNGLYDVNNIASGLFGSFLEDALIIIDKQYRYKGCNQSARILFPQIEDFVLDKDIRSELPFLNAFLSGEMQYFYSNDKRYKVIVNEWKQDFATDGIIVRLEDITVASEKDEMKHFDR